MNGALDVLAPAEVIVAATAPADNEASDMPPVEIVLDSPPVSAEMVFDEDADLLDRLATDDEAAFRMLVERHIDRAYSIALRILSNAADAEDVVQDTMLKVWTHRGRWQHGRAKFSTWLYRVVSNRCIDLRRKPRTENVEAVPEVADTQPDAVRVIERNELSNLLEAAMQRLPEQQRIAVILSYHENMSNAEIAEVMDTTIAAVESLLKRGRQQLRARLSGDESELRAAFTDF
ncbi:RNA polymerase sigma factor [Rhodopseudomonas palustris]|uniref:RNA polymerase sigma factor n=1 Tax=Rhodopseudomonas palustris TaxID=1076 RepID=UPI000E5A904D|nr:RNA polymerase sigma factor [Rhodopseudomonas palustris]QLH69841.1 RNA polymerase sigma factor [Rhodopseudomonas palustris]RIA03400.1 RNA polymerase sigma factor [Rhodopseudomonas palustris]WBU30528.1 RNA polymerase sigma factor [Rhodopseudomonas palustris]